jgi:hypothetical protein
MIRILFILIAVTSLTISVQAQFCEISVSATDATCTTTDVCVDRNDDGCVSTTFSVPCTDNYCVKIQTINCNGTECKKCMSEAYLYENDGTFVICIHTGCSTNCSDQQTCPALTAGSYKLYVCKINCSGEGSCEVCSASCQARASVYLQP